MKYTTQRLSIGYRLLSVFVATILLILMLDFIMPDVVRAAQTKVDYYDTGADTAAELQSLQYGQSFNATSSYRIDSIQLKLGYSTAPPATLHCELWLADVDGYPTGSLLASSNVSATYLGDYPGGGGGWWVSFVFGTPYTVTTGVSYTILAYGTGGDASRNVRWSQKSAGAYTGGRAIKWSEAGSCWTNNGNADMMFRTYNGFDSPTITDDSTLSNFATTSITIDGYLTGFGGDSSVNCGIVYGTTSGVYDYSSSNTTISYSLYLTQYASQAFATNLTGLSPRTTYYYKIGVTNQAGTVWSSEFTFATKSTYDNVWSVLTLTSPGSGRTGLSEQVKLVYANGYYWWLTSNTTASFRYLSIMSSNDTVTWSPLSAIDTTLDDVGEGEYFSLTTDGTYLYAVWAVYGLSSDVYFIRGLANANGTVTWDAKQTVASGAAIAPDGYVKPVVSIDSNGYPWVVWGETQTVGNEYSWISKSSTNDGTWVDDTDFPYNDSGVLNFLRPKIVSMDSGKMYYLNASITGAVRVRGLLWNGSGWTAENVTPEAIPNQYTPSYSATCLDDIVYFSWIDSTGNFKLVSRAVDGTWSNATILASSLDPHGVTQLTVINDVVYALWMKDNTIYYRQYSGGTWGSAVEFKWDAEAYDSGAISTAGTLTAIEAPNSPELVVMIASARNRTDIELGMSNTALAAITTGVASNVTITKDGYTTATLNGNLTSIGEALCTVWFDWGPTAGYGNTTSNITLGSPGTFGLYVDSHDLTPGATYHFRAVVTNVEGRTDGSDATFTYTTPTVVATSASAGSNTVTLGSTVTLNKATSAYFRVAWGYDNSLPNSTATSTVSTSGPVSTTLTGAAPGTTIYYRMILTVGATTSQSALASYMIPQSPTSVTSQAFPVAFLVIVVVAALISGITVASTGEPFVGVLVAAVVVILGIIGVVIIQAASSGIY